MNNQPPQLRINRPEPFHCPNCGAGLELDGLSATTTCQYCGTNILIPEEFRPQDNNDKDVPSLEPIVIEISQLEQPHPTPRTIKGGWVFLIIFFAIIIPTILIGLLSLYIFNQSVKFTRQEIINPLDNVPTITIPTDEVPTPDPYIQPILEFGDEGTAPGKFDDARQIAVDMDRNIYVADYNTGRLQKFDPQGRFVYQIMVEPGRNGTWIISDLAIDPDNRLYVVRVGDLLIYDGSNGNLISSINGQDMDAYFQSIAIDPSKRLYAVSTSALDDSLFILDSKGNIQQFDEFVTQVNSDDAAMDLTIAVDGMGNSYVLSTFGRQVYSYNRFGEFVDRFGSINDESGSFWTASGIAVDGKQRIYMPNLSDIQIFDNNGFPISNLMVKPGTGALRDLAIDSEGFLYLITGNGKVFKFPPIEP